MTQAIGKMVVMAALAAGMSWATGVDAATTPAQKCQAGKDGVAGKYAACRNTAAAKLATTGNTTKYSDALEKCAAKFAAAWEKLETKAGGACPSNGDALGVAAVVDVCTGDVATAAGGGAVSSCSTSLTQCNSNLSTCQASSGSGQLLKTGKTSCSPTFEFPPATITCPGTGQDGESQRGAARSYTDNGDGTITDNATGLTWEKLSDDKSIHDKDDTYAWSDAFKVKIQALNAKKFAGHNDWRLPNLTELDSLVNAGTDRPAIEGVFNVCTPGCSATTCNCNPADGNLGHSQFWSSTTIVQTPERAWLIDFFYGYGDDSFITKAEKFHVRAVRGG